MVIPVPSNPLGINASNLSIIGQESYFNEDARFYKDVYVYGVLYYDFKASGPLEFDSITVINDSSFLGNVDISKDLDVGGDVSIGGSLGVEGKSYFGADSYFDESVYIEDNLNVGILTVREKLDVGYKPLYDGLGNLSGYKSVFTAIVDDPNNVTGRVGVNSSSPEQTLDVIGNMRLSSQLYDSLNNPGALGAFLTKDNQGVKWTIFEPSFTEGIFVYNEGVLVGVDSFRGINLITGDSFGIDVDSVEGEVNPSNPFIADIYVTDRWATFDDTTIYRNSNVGINIEVPLYSFHVVGDVKITEELDVDNISYFRSNIESTAPTNGAVVITSGGLGVFGNANIGNNVGIGGNLFVNGTVDVYGATRVYNQLTVDGPTVLNDTLSVVGITNLQNRLIVGGATSLNSTLSVVGITTLQNRLIVGGATSLNSTLSVVGVTTLQNRLIVGGATSLNSTLDVIGETNLQNRLIVGGATSLNSTLSVVGVTTLKDRLQVDGSTFLNDTLDVQKLTTLQDDLKVGGATTIGGNLYVVGITTLEKDLKVGGALTVSNTLNVGGATTIRNNLDVIGITTIRDDLNVKEDTYLEKRLKVGFDGEVITTTGVGSVGFGTNNPQRDIEFSNKDVYYNGGAIYDTNNNVGFRTEQYQVPRNVLTTVGVDTSGNIIGGRFYDAANLIRINLDFIANEAVGFITSTEYKNPEFTLNTLNYSSCKDDIKDIFKAITYDITRGGNSRSVGAGLSYYNGNSLIHITGTDINGYSIQDASVAAIEKAVEVSRFVINNSYYPTSFQMKAINGIYADAGRLILKNKDFIATEAVDRTLVQYPSLTIPNGNQSCIDDIKLVLDAIIYNIQFGGNSRLWDVGRFYIVNAVLSGEENEAVYAFNEVKTIAIQIIRNEVVTKISGALNTFTQYIDPTVLPDPISPTCQNQASAITSFIKIVTDAITLKKLPNRTDPTIVIPVPQIKDLTLQDDPLRGSNSDPDGCANVVSAITVCAGIVTTIIKQGPSASPNVTKPDGKIFWAPAGADSRNIIYVSKYGNDDNNGRTEGAAKLTIGAAAAIAQPGDTIMIRSGVYAENNPIGLRRDVSVSGQDLRLVTIYPQNNDDVFYVRRGCLIENLSFAYSKDPFDDAAPLVIDKGAAVAFPPPAGIASARSGYLEPGPANEGPTGRWRSPYIRNCTNFMTRSIGMKINGDHAIAATIGNDLKCMVCDSFTQYNEAGIGVSITNNGYAQLVSIFTINCHIAIYADSGGSCDLTNSNSSFGNFGLVAVGLGSTEFTGKVGTYPPDRTQPGVNAGSDKVTFYDMKDASGNPRRPYDGQALFFKIDLNNYPDAVSTGLPSSILQEPMVQVQAINVTNGGSGYSAINPPTVVIRDADDLSQQPKGPQGIISEVSPTIDPITGAITTIDVVNSGRNYLPSQNLEVFIDGSGGATAEVITQPIYYTIDVATEPTNAGLTTITFNEFIPYELFGDEDVALKRISRILTSSHSFEYVGSGTDINIATPFKGAVPIKENEIVALDGAQIPFTSTDQKGNFDIGEGFQINQPTATIRGRDFSKAIQAEVTPLILALR